MTKSGSLSTYRLEMLDGDDLMTEKKRLGEILIEKKLVDEADINKALRAQIGGNRRLGHLLVGMKCITADQLAETLADHLGLEISDIAAKHSAEASKVLPRYLCRQYGVLPLAVKKDNLLEMAMADPCDEEAINNLEQYTGKVVMPFLAKQSEIEREIPVRVPLGVKDFFSPQFNTSLTRVGVGLCIVLLVALGSYTVGNVRLAKYGTEEIAKDSTIYKNHDLILEVKREGGLKFSGRSAFAKGYYSVRFNDKQEFLKFLDRRQADFSDKQTGWLGWAVSQKLQ